MPGISMTEMEFKQARWMKKACKNLTLTILFLIFMSNYTYLKRVKV